MAFEGTPTIPVLAYDENLGEIGSGGTEYKIKHVMSGVLLQGCPPQGGILRSAGERLRDCSVSIPEQSDSRGLGGLGQRRFREGSADRLPGENWKALGGWRELVERNERCLRVCLSAVLCAGAEQDLEGLAKSARELDKLARSF